MNRAGLTLAAAAFALASALLAFRIFRADANQRAAVRRRLSQIRQDGSARRGAGSSSGAAERSASAWMRIAALVGQALARSGLLPAATLRELREGLGNTALAGSNGLAVFIGLKVLGAVGGVAAGFLGGRTFGMGSLMQLTLSAAGGAIGLLGPDYALRRMRRTYVARVQAGLPDALDMLVICSEAGLALEPGIERVSVELGPAHPQTAREFGLTAQEMRLIADRAEVLANLGSRTGLEDLRRLGATLIQTVQFGTPITQALRTLAVEMRQETMTRYEARAARLSVFLAMPMILFILPCVLIIVGGPAVIQIVDALGKK